MKSKILYILGFLLFITVVFSLELYLTYILILSENKWYMATFVIFFATMQSSVVFMGKKFQMKKSLSELLVFGLFFVIAISLKFLIVK